MIFNAIHSHDDSQVKYALTTCNYGLIEGAIGNNLSENVVIKALVERRKSCELRWLLILFHCFDDLGAYVNSCVLAVILIP